MSSIYDKIVISPYMTKKKRIILQSWFYDENGTALTSSTQSSKQKILVTNDYYTIRTAKLSGELELDTTKNSLTGFEVKGDEESVVYLEEDEFSNFETELKKLFKNISSLDFSFAVNENFASFSTDILKIMISTYANVSIDLGYGSDSVLIPEGTFKMQSFSAKNASFLISNENTTIDTTVSTNFENCTFNKGSSDYGTLILLTSGTVNLSNITEATPVLLKININTPKDRNTFASTKVSINDFKALLSNYNEPINKDYSLLNRKPIVDITGSSTVSIVNFTITDGVYYNGVSCTSCNTVRISDITRTSLKDPIASSTIYLNTVSETYISNIVVNSASQASASYYAIDNDPTTFNAFNTISVSDFDITNMTLIHLGSITLKRVSLSGKSSSEYLMKTDGSLIQDLNLNSVTFTGSYLTIEGLKASITDSTINCSKGFGALLSKSFSLTTSSIDSGLYDSDFDIQYDATVTITGSTINAKNITFYSSLLVDENDYLHNKENQSLDIKTSTFKASGDIFVEDIYATTFTDFTIESTKSFNVSTSSRFIASPMVLKCNLSNIPITIKDSTVNKSSLNIIDPPSKHTVTFTNCTGDFGVNYADSVTTDSALNLQLTSSPIRFKVNSTNTDTARKIKFKSDSSLGAVVFSYDTNITPVPDVACKDEQYLKSITSYAIDSSYVNYGVTTSNYSN